MGVSSQRWVHSGFVALLALFATHASGQEGAVPADKFDLSEWYITLPVDENNDNKADNISVEEIQSFSHPDFFYLDENGGMVFTSPNKALTTANSTNTRSELRHMLRGGNTKIKTKSPKNSFTVASNPIANRFARVGGKMEATLSVNHVALRAKNPDKPPAYSVVVGQIHATKWEKKVKGFGWGNEPLKIYYKKWPGHDTGSVFWTYERNLPKDDPNRTDIAYPVWGNLWTSPENPGEQGIALGEEFSYVVNVHGDVMYLTFESPGHETVEYQINLANAVDANGDVDPHDHPYGYTLDWNYFKAGAYNQCSTKDDPAFWYPGCLGTGNWEEDKANGDYASVTFTRLEVGESVPPKPNHGKKAQVGSTLNEKEAFDISRLPESALAAIKAIAPEFTVKEAEKEYKHGKTYLDVEGHTSDGSEIEFDMLQVDDSWKVVEVQRDLTWEQLPAEVTKALTSHDASFKPKRIIESKQYGTDITVYEFYAVDSQGNESRKEVKVEAGTANVLEKEWEH
jgi:hypothetical protein